MKTLVTAMALAAIIASPAFAQKKAKQMDPLSFGNSYNAVIDHGRVVGQDPDPNIRFQLLRDPYASEWGGGN